MKTILITLFFCALACSVFSQKWLEEKAWAGGGIAFGTNISNLGAHAMALYKISESVRIAPNFTYFIPKKEEFFGWTRTNRLWEINMDAHYCIPFEKENVKILGIGGLNLTRRIQKGKAKDASNTSEEYNYNKPAFHIGVNIGAGFEYKFADPVKSLLEIKYVFSEYQQMVIKVAMIFRLKKKE